MHSVSCQIWEFIVLLIGSLNRFDSFSCNSIGICRTVISYWLRLFSIIFQHSEKLAINLPSARFECTLCVTFTSVFLFCSQEVARSDKVTDTWRHLPLPKQCLANQLIWHASQPQSELKAGPKQLLRVTKAAAAKNNCIKRDSIAVNLRARPCKSFHFGRLPINLYRQNAHGAVIWVLRLFYYTLAGLSRFPHPDV